MTGPLLLTLLFAAGPTDVSKAEMTRLRKGEVLIKTSRLSDGGIRTHAKALVKAPIERIWPIIDQCADYKTTMPRIAESEELSRKGNIITCRIEADLPFPLPNLVSVTRATHTVKPGDKKREWQLIKGDYKHNTGYWHLKSHDDGKSTLMFYKLELEPNMPVPDAILEAGQKRTLPSMFERLRTATEKAD